MTARLFRGINIHERESVKQRLSKKKKKSHVIKNSLPRLTKAAAIFIS